MSIQARKQIGEFCFMVIGKAMLFVEQQGNLRCFIITSLVLACLYVSKGNPL